ncbi:MAG: cysteine--tRNA ligase [Vulcanimicrobiaceae bacterium]
MLQLYNTLTRNVADFVPLRRGEVRMYVCGLTPSAEPHLGHARSFLFFDVLRAYLRHLGYRVTYVQNVTDVDDRSIEAAREEGVPWNEVVQRYYTSFKNSMRTLGVAEPDIEPRATEYVPQIIAMIERLVQSGHAYVGEDGVYFRVSMFSGYGKLSGKQTDELLIGARIAENEKKLDPLDFALWKFAKTGEPSWPSPWGAGRPGWHIECSAMAHELLGEPFDIHGGGTDLIFPHHENEIAQSESLSEPPMANFWIHGGMLNFEQRKMSKSLGNYEPLSEFLTRSDPQAIRLLFLQTGYRKPMNFTEDSLAAATTALGKLRKAFRALSPEAMPAREAADFDRIIERVEAALDDDMNTSAALAVLFDVAAKADAYASEGKAKPAAGAFGYALDLLRIVPNESWLQEKQIDVDGVAARLRERLGEVVVLADDGHQTIASVVAARDQARKSKNFALADKLREALAAEQIELHDTRDGTTWTLAGG